jgi:RNA-directed DNA polymerase
MCAVKGAGPQRGYTRPGTGSLHPVAIRAAGEATKKRVLRICEAISEMTGRDQTLQDQEMVVAKLNRTMVGWANYFCLGAVSKAYRAVEQHAFKRLRQWLCAKHKVVWPGTKRFPEPLLHTVLGLIRLTKRARSLPWATS